MRTSVGAVGAVGAAGATSTEAKMSKVATSIAEAAGLPAGNVLFVRPNYEANTPTKEVKPKATRTTAKKSEEVAVEAVEVPARVAVSVSAMLEKAEKLHLLKVKYEELNEKRKRLEKFEISHDKDNAQMTLVDAAGESFESSNPNCIRRLIDIWKEDFAAAIAGVENQMRTLITE